MSAVRARQRPVFFIINAALLIDRQSTRSGGRLGDGWTKFGFGFAGPGGFAWLLSIWVSFRLPDEQLSVLPFGLDFVHGEIAHQR